jgi:hypothetical protein
MKIKKWYPDGESTISKRKFYNTGEYRIPKKGERYLSGAIPEAYIAPNDFLSKYYIAKECDVIIEEKIIPLV